MFFCVLALGACGGLDCGGTKSVIIEEWMTFNRPFVISHRHQYDSAD
jgi:hypothetical protein